jgi:kynurenine formamidase
MKLFKRLPQAILAATFLAATSASAGVIYETVKNWGPDDELGNKNYWNNQTTLDAAKLVKKGNVYSLAVWFDRTTPLWPGHPAFEWVNFRTPKGVLRVDKDHSWLFPAEEVNKVNFSWTSGLFMGTEHTGTHMDTFSHIMAGPNDAIYNGFSSNQYHGDFGWHKAGAETIPPFFVRAIMIDIAAEKGHRAGTWNMPKCNKGYLPGCEFRPGGQLPDSYAITPADTQNFLRKHNLTINKGDVVVFRTGRIGEWYEDAKMGFAGKMKYGRPEAGPNLATARWLVQQGVSAIGADNVAVEVFPTGVPGDPHPVHIYTLIDNGVHILENLWLEDLSRDGVYEFLFSAAPIRMKGATGSMWHPAAVN